jgi:ABC-2 type transport system permease protein
MNKALAVARWEYVEKIKSKAFLISLFIMPIIMVAMGVIPTLLATRADTEPRVIGVIDETGELTKLLSTKFEEKYKLPDGRPNYLFRSINESNLFDISEAKKKGDELVISEEIEGYIILRSTIYNDSTFEYRSQNVGNFKLTERINRTLRDIIVEKKLRAEGLDPEFVKKLTSDIDIRSVKISKSGEEEEAGFEKVFFSAYIFIMMMMFLVMTSGQLLVRSMVEEKSNRIVEVLMSSCSAKDLIVGKILGLSGLGFTQIGFWALIGTTIALKFGVALIALSHALILLIFFVLGYLFYAAVFVAVGSPLSTEQEAQQVTSYLVLIFIIPLIIAMPVMQDPNSVLVSVLTFIPLLTPTMMALRIPIQMPSAIEVIAAIIVMILSTIIAMWAAAKIFRTAILAYGKRPSIKEIVSLLRAK